MPDQPTPTPPPKRRGKAPKKYSPEFRASTARLVTEEGRAPAQVARDLGISRSMVHRWVEEARRGGPRPAAALSSGEREELERLRRENKVLKMEREILKKAAAFFARESQ